MTKFFVDILVDILKAIFKLLFSLLYRFSLALVTPVVLHILSVTRRKSVEQIIQEDEYPLAFILTFMAMMVTFLIIAGFFILRNL